MYDSWEILKNQCLNCNKCGLCETRTNVVFGEGNPQAEVMFIGEGPGEQEDWLRNQTALLKPKIIVAVGRIAAQKIIDENIKITKDHGKFYKKKKILMMPTIHPAAVLRNPNQKSLVEDDFNMLKLKIREICCRTYL